MPAIKDRMRLKTKMRNVLIAAGQEGIGQAEFIQKVRTKLFPSVEIRLILEDWNMRGLVQRFKTKQSHSKRPVIVWRATVLIKSERL